MGWILFPAGVGWKQRASTVATGTFACPNPGCKGKRSASAQEYRVRQARNWIVALYVPILPLNRGGVYVECRSCKSFYSLEILERQRKPQGIPALGSPPIAGLPPAPAAGRQPALASGPVSHAVEGSLESRLDLHASPTSDLECAHCGKPLTPQDRFCGSCGTAAEPEPLAHSGNERGDILRLYGIDDAGATTSTGL